MIHFEKFDGKDVKWLNSLDEIKSIDYSSGENILAIDANKFPCFDDLAISELNSAVVKSIYIANCENFDLSNLEYLDVLEELALCYSKPRKLITIDHTKLTKLVLVGIKGITSINCKNVRYLRIIKCGITELDSIKELEKIEKLVLQRVGLESLNFGNYIKKLTSIEMSYMTRLTSIGNLNSCTSVKVLEIRNSKKISDIEDVSLPELEELYLSNNMVIEDISFINNNKRLRRFGIGDTNILDGDLKLSEKLDFFGFTKKKHFKNIPNKFK